jgi:hypothetical protein
MDAIVIGTVCFTLATGGSICLQSHGVAPADAANFSIACLDTPGRLPVGPVNIPTCREWLEKQR